MFSINFNCSPEEIVRLIFAYHGITPTPQQELEAIKNIRQKQILPAGWSSVSPSGSSS